MYTSLYLYDRKFLKEHLPTITNRQLLKEFRQSISEHAWMLPCTQREPFLYLGERAKPQLRKLEWEIGEYAVELTKRGYNISKIGF
jgi:hypothetical protein